MGYITYFDLEIEDTKNTEDNGYIIEEKQEMLERYAETADLTDNDTLVELLRYGSCEAKWYDCDEDMIKISKEFPTIEFILSGEGEDREDYWIKNYLGGKLIRHRVAMLTYTDV